MTSNNKKKVPLVITEENNKPKLKMRRMVLGTGHYLSPEGGGGGGGKGGVGGFWAKPDEI